MVKWGGLAVSVLLAVAWVGSCWYVLWWEMPGDDYFGVQAGRFGRMSLLLPLEVPGGGGFSLDRQNTTMEWRFALGRFGRDVGFAIPLWAPLLIAACATAVAWRADARARRLARAGACPACGYDRRGLEVGRVCPECGAAGGG
jgi:predicted RNA-binding Zn-ribbon protein involved in translation (DUF1610 family)